jgi:hypothetical protein
MSIALFAALLYAGSSYVKTDNYLIKSYKGTIESSAINLASQFIAYENLKGYTLQQTDWESEIFSINRFTPKSLDNTTWSYNNDNSGIFFCMSGNINENQYKAFKEAEENLNGKAFVNSSCGATTSLNYAGNYPVTAAITFWIRN